MKAVILQFRIETSNYPRFQYAFTTDKYINLFQWECLMSKINKTIIGVCRGKENWENKKVKFAVENLIVSYEFVDKNEGLMNYEKIEYEFDWIVMVTINKSSTIQESCSIQESQTTNGSSPKKRTSSSSKESNSQNDENIVIEDDDDDEHVHESKKAKIDESSVLQQTNRYNLKTRKERSEKQSSITNWISSKKPKQSKSSIEDTKPQKSKEKSKEPKPTTSKDALALINKEQLQQMNDFVARSEQEELNKQKRKEELKDYKIFNCYDMSNERIVE